MLSSFPISSSRSGWQITLGYLLDSLQLGAHSRCVHRIAPFLFSGTVELHFRANSDTPNIVLNSVDLSIDEDGIELSVHPDSPEPADDPVLSMVEEHPQMEFYTLILQVPVEENG